MTIGLVQNREEVAVGSIVALYKYDVVSKRITHPEDFDYRGQTLPMTASIDLKKLCLQDVVHIIDEEYGEMHFGKREQDRWLILIPRALNEHELTVWEQSDSYIMDVSNYS